MMGRRHAVRKGKLLLTAMVICLLVVELSSADHLSWMRPYKAFDGGSCCGDSDCVPAAVVAGPHGEVIVNGVRIKMPPGSVHPVPEGVESGW
jgi:hypothetical protein